MESCVWRRVDLQQIVAEPERIVEAILQSFGANSVPIRVACPSGHLFSAKKRK